MADYKPDEINYVTAADCISIDESSEQWFDMHMACWICTKDSIDGRKEMMYNEFCEMYFHKSCIDNRETNGM